MSTIKKSSNTKTIVGIVVAAVLVLAILLGLRINTAIQVKANITDNQKIINDNGKLVGTKLSELVKMAENAPEGELSQVTKSSQEFFTTAKAELDNSKNLTSQAKEKLTAGINDDTKEYYNESKKVMDKRVELLDQMDLVILDLECINTKFLTIATNFETVGSQLSSISSTSTNTAAIIDSTLPLIKTAQDNNIAISTCFQTALKDFYTPALATAIQNDSKYYADFGTALSLLSDGVKTNSLTKVNQANSQIGVLASKSPELADNPDFTSVLETRLPETLQKNVAELDAQNESLNKISKRISDKYFGI